MLMIMQTKFDCIRTSSQVLKHGALQPLSHIGSTAYASNSHTQWMPTSLLCSAGVNGKLLFFISYFYTTVTWHGRGREGRGWWNWFIIMSPHMYLMHAQTPCTAYTTTDTYTPRWSRGQEVILHQQEIVVNMSQHTENRPKCRVTPFLTHWLHHDIQCMYS